MLRKTYLNDFITLSALPAGWAPGDSFRRLKIPSLFFMSLALEDRSREGSRSAWQSSLKIQGREAVDCDEGHLLLHCVSPL